MLRSRFLWKLFAAYAAVLLLILAWVGELIAGRVATARIDDALRQLESDAVALATEFADRMDHGADGLDRALSPRLRRLVVVEALHVIATDLEGRVLATYPPSFDRDRAEPIDGPIWSAAMRDGLASSRRGEEDAPGLIAMARLDVDEQPVGMLRASRELGEHSAPVRDVVLIAAAFGVLAAFGLAWFHAGAVERPVLEMTRSARLMAKGNFDGRVAVVERDSFGHLAGALNRLAETSRERMDEMTTDRRRVLAILGAMIEGVVAVDADCCVAHMNAAAARILGTQSANTNGRHISEVTRVREVREILERAIASGEGQRGEVRVVVPPRDRWAEMLASPLRDGDREIAGAVLVLHDVTELRRLEAIRREFVANVSHELKTPIAAIRGMVETVLDDPAMLDAVRDRFLGRVRDQAFRLSTLVTDLLTLSRMEASSPVGERVLLDFRRPVQDSIAALVPTAETAGITIHAELADDNVPVLGEGESLRLVATNLLDNAIKYTPPGGQVWVRVERSGHRALLSVTDTGVGIERKHLDRIFQRFYRVDKARSRELGGTGLGLSIVKHVCIAHDGTVRVESTPGRGSMFQVELPLA